MYIPYQDESGKKISELYDKVSPKPISLLNCDDFSYWRKIILVIITIAYFHISIIPFYFLYKELISLTVMIILIITMPVIVFFLHCFIVSCLNEYKSNLEYEFKNYPSPKKLLSLVYGLLDFITQKGYRQDEVSVFISEKSQKEGFIMQSVNELFAMSKIQAAKNSQSDKKKRSELQSISSLDCNGFPYWRKLSLVITKIVSYLNLYKLNIEYELKNDPSSRKLLLLIYCLLAFLQQKGYKQDVISSFIDEELRKEVRLSKTTINKWFSMSKNEEIRNNIKNKWLFLFKMKIELLKRLFKK